MTTLRVNMPAGQISKERVTTTGGSAISTDICRIQLDDANATKEQVLHALAVMTQFITQKQWPL